MGDEYSLTPLAREFIEPMEMLYEWGRAHAAALDRLGQRPRSKRGGTWQAEMINRAYEGEQAPMGAFRFRAQRHCPSASASGAELPSRL
jgi:hypothetical protein